MTLEEHPRRHLGRLDLRRRDRDGVTTLVQAPVRGAEGAGRRRQGCQALGMVVEAVGVPMLLRTC